MKTLTYVLKLARLSEDNAFRMSKLPHPYRRGATLLDYVDHAISKPNQYDVRHVLKIAKMCLAGTFNPCEGLDERDFIGRKPWERE